MENKKDEIKLDEKFQDLDDEPKRYFYEGHYQYKWNIIDYSKYTNKRRRLHYF